MKNNSVQILGVRIDNVTFDEAIQKALKVLKGKERKYFTTPNPEITLAALKNKKYQDILNESELNIPDGTGLLFASRFLKAIGKSKTVLKERVTGTDMTIKLTQLSSTEGFSVFYLGASEESNTKTIEYAKQHGAHVAGGYTSDINSKECIDAINKAQPDLLFVALGFPRQETWISENLSKLSSVKLAIGIGGAFDFIAGTRKRAPHLLQKLGLEWVYRLIQEPKRIRRIFNAVIVFPVKVLLNSFSSSK